MQHSDLVEQILETPDSYKVLEEVQSVLKKEQKARLEFREWLKDDIKAEFINGEVIMHSPVKRGHLQATRNLLTLLSPYVILKKLGEVASEKALIALSRNDYEPDLCFWTTEQAKDFDKDTMVHPAPVFVVEVLSKSTQHKDKGIKFKDYAAHDITEYWMINYKKELVLQYVLLTEKPKEYTLIKEWKTDEEIESTVIKGFKIPVKAIFDETENLLALQKVLKR
ncbi:MAG: Uma2 family endonuclease [Saprospiraceae bacterium]